MENLNIEATKYTPKIDLDFDKGILEFKGKSYPENTFEFYKPIQEWISEYFETCKDKKTEVNFDINYLNSSSIKFFYDLFDTLESAQEGCPDLKVQWFYDEEDDMALETGEDFQEDYENLNVTLVVK
jgi:hypothetical protein